MRKPNLIIAGVNKAGTTSLFAYLASHPEICASDIKETCYFLPLRFGKDIEPIGEYLRHFWHCREEKYVMESTPGYFYGSRAIPRRIREELENPKILIIVRDPVRRFYSFYKHLKVIMRIPKETSLGRYVKLCEEYSLGKENDAAEYGEASPYRGIREGFYDEYIPEWMTTFGTSLKITFFEHMTENPVFFIEDVCRWLGIGHGMYSAYRFDVENRSIEYRNALLHKLGLTVNRKMESVFRDMPVVKHYLRRFYYFLNEGRPENVMEHEIAEHLESVYSSHNERLLGILRDCGCDKLPHWLVMESKTRSLRSGNPFTGKAKGFRR